jgi:hypothetical protein
VVDRHFIDLPQNERPLNFMDFSYDRKTSSDELFENVAAIISFTFGRRNPNSFIGPTLNIVDHDITFYEAQSFAEVANQAWERYQRSDKYAKYVQRKLTKTWVELNGEKLTGITLKFDRPPQNP